MRTALAGHGRRLVVCQSAALGCLYSSAPTRRRRSPLRQLTPLSLRRTFLNALFQKPPREVRPPEYEPGWMQIMLWRSRILDNLRPPRRKELLEAWKQLMQSKIKKKQPLNSTQALQCRRLLEYLTRDPDPAQPVRPLSSADLAMARRVLLEIEPRERTQHHLDLAKALHAVSCSGNFSGKVRSPEVYWSLMIKLYSLYGASLEALQLLYSNWKDPAYAVFLTDKDRLVDVVARGLAREARGSELVELVERAEEIGIPYDSGLQEIMVEFFVQQNHVAEAQRWFSKPIVQLRCRPTVYRAMASLAMRNNLQDWAIPFFLELGQAKLGKTHWDVLLQANLLFGKSIGEIDEMMSHMVNRDGMLLPDTKTINRLLSVAIEKEDAQMAEKILFLGSQKGIMPNVNTHLLMLRLNLVIGDLEGARTAYEQVRFADYNVKSSNAGLFEIFQQLLNQFLMMLSRQPEPDFKLITSLLEAIDEEEMGLDPETMASLCLKLLENDQHFDVMDILSAHCFKYSEGERELIQKAFVRFCLNPQTSTARAWSGYQILQQFFQDTTFERRTQLMETFINRRRTDMAAHVFRHMREHRNRSYNPTMDTYVQCLEGIARYPDGEPLAVVHNILKLDMSIQLTTRLYTALMLAYAACGDSSTALDFWKEITESRQGPSHASLEAVFWALEKKLGGDIQAREIWDRIEKMEIEIPPAVYNAYVGAIAGSGNEKEVRGLIMRMASVVGSEPDAKT